MADLSVSKLCKFFDETFHEVEKVDEVEVAAELLAERFDRPKAQDYLFDYQFELVKLSLKLTDQGGSALLSLPTGGGKTRTAVATVLEYLSTNNSGRVAWLAPTNELLEQAHSTFSRIWGLGIGPKSLGVNRTGIQNADSYVWLATPQGVNQKVAQKYNFVVFDEAHQLQARTYTQAVDRIRDEKSFLLGLSATPGRTKEEEISELVELFGGTLLTSSILGNRPVEALRERGILSQIDYKKISNSPTALSRFKDSVNLVRDLLEKEKKVLFFGRNLEEAEALQKLMVFYGHKAWFVEGGTNEKIRKQNIESFAECESGVLTNQKLLTTGYDCPAVTDVVLGVKVGSPILFEQMVGRASRGVKVGGAPNATVWQFDDHVSIHGEPQAHIRFKEGHWETAQF